MNAISFLDGDMDESRSPSEARVGGVRRCHQPDRCSQPLALSRPKVTAEIETAPTLDGS